MRREAAEEKEEQTLSLREGRRGGAESKRPGGHWQRAPHARENPYHRSKHVSLGGTRHGSAPRARPPGS